MVFLLFMMILVMIGRKKSDKCEVEIWAKEKAESEDKE